MASYAKLDDGSYLIEREGQRPIRTALDPVEYGYELRSPEELSGYVPQPPTAEERLSRVASGLDRMRRENDPEYAALAQQEELQQEAEQTRQRFEREGAELKSEREGRTVAQNDLVVPDGQSAADFQNQGSFLNRAPTAVAPTKNLQRSVPTQTQPKPTATQPTGQDSTRAALSNIALSGLYKRTPASRGGWTPTQATTQREAIPTPEALAGVERAARKVDAIGDQAIESRAQALNDTVIQPELARVESDMNSLRADYVRRKKLDEEQERLKRDAEATERKAAEMPRINARQDYWADKGGFARFLLAVSQGLFAFGQGLAGQSGPNAVTEAIEREIDANGEKLRAEHDDAIAAGKTKRNAYSDHLAQYGDPQSASRALRLEGQAIGDRARSIQLQRYGTVEQQQEWEMAKAQRAEQRAKEYADLSAKAAGSTVTSSRYSAPSNGSVSMDPKAIDLWLKLNPNGSSDAEGVKLRRESLQDERAVRLPPTIARRVGQPAAYAKDKEASDKATEALRTTDIGIAAINNMEQILARGGGTVLAEDREDMETQIGVISATLANPLAFRQQTGPEMEITRSLGGASALNLVTTLGGPERAAVAIKRARELFKRNENLWLRELKNDIGPQGQYIVPDVNTDE